MVTYETKYKLIFCDCCGEMTSHVSNNGDDFYCLVCFDKDKERQYYTFTDRENDAAIL